MKSRNFIYVAISLLFTWIKRPRNVGIALVGLGLTTSPLLSLFSRLTYSKNNGLTLTPEEITWSDFVGLAVVIIGLLLLLHERFRGESSPRNRAKSIDLRSLQGATAPMLCDAFPAVIDQAGLHTDLYFESDIYTNSGMKPAPEFLATVTEQLNRFSSTFVKKARQDSLKPFALGAIAHVPFCFALGFLVGNKSQCHYYCWNRDKKKWIDCRNRPDLGSFLSFKIHKVDKTANTDVRTVGMSVEISFQSDENTFITSTSLDACVKVSVDNQSIGNIFSDIEQTRLVGQIREYINHDLRRQFPNLSELHITIMAQASFIMRLGAEFNQNHMPKTFVYHYDANSTEKYPWNLELTPGSEKIDWNCK